ncbi:hypothetical protein KC717_03555, partial [Candidatus Dojkabacteria bacterium]|nr:hypothetical protein [Candidatus Dojkabacteria bacterium]
KAQLELYPKRDHVMKQFKKMGLGIRQLTTDELIHLYYTMYDPDKTGYRQQNLDSSAYTADIITRGKEKIDPSGIKKV